MSCIADCCIGHASALRRGGVQLLGCEQGGNLKMRALLEHLRMHVWCMHVCACCIGHANAGDDLNMLEHWCVRVHVRMCAWCARCACVYAQIVVMHCKLLYRSQSGG